MCFLLSKFLCFPCFPCSHHDLEISFNLNDYFSFTTTTLDSVTVKITANLKQKLFLGIFLQIPSHFHTNWLIFEGLATKVNLNQIQNTETKTFFLRPQAKIPRKFDPPY
jgi:hypothetical protein